MKVFHEELEINYIHKGIYKIIENIAVRLSFYHFISSQSWVQLNGVVRFMIVTNEFYSVSRGERGSNGQKLTNKI